MKIKKEYIILAGIIIALSLYLVFHETNETNYTLPAIQDIEKKEISKIEVKKTDATIVLNKKDDAWVIEPQGYPANSGKVDSMLDVLDSLKLTDMISEKKNTETYERYELDDDKKISVSAFDGDNLKLAFDIGKTAPSYRHTFVKLKDDPSVYYAAENFRSKFDNTLENLRDTSVLTFDKNEITAVSINKAGKASIYQKNTIPVEVTPTPEKEGEEPEKAPEPETKLVWQDKNGKEIDTSKINRIMSSLSNLKCASYMADDKKDTLKDPIYTVTFKGVEEHTLSVFPKEDKDAGKYPAVSSQNDYAFYLNKSTADDFMKIFDEEKKDEKKGSAKGKSKK